MPGGHGGVGGEEGRGPGELQGLPEGVPLGHKLPEALKAQEGRVPLVHVEEGGGEAQGPEEPHPPRPRTSSCWMRARGPRRRAGP